MKKLLIDTSLPEASERRPPIRSISPKKGELGRGLTVPLFVSR